jgi:SAM-dependent methyltransferase
MPFSGNLRRQFRSDAKNWEFLGRNDPLFGILSDRSKCGGKWDVDEFFASGRDHIQSLLRTLRDLRVSYQQGSCLDFGCGVGRLTLPLSEVFTHAVGVDVAPSMIERARQFHAANSRCEFRVNAEQDLHQFPDATFDFVHSCLVLQHVPPEIAVRYIAEFFRVCKPGGLVVFQLPSERRREWPADPLPDSSCSAAIAVLEHPAAIAASEFATLRVDVINKGLVPWPHDIPAGRHLAIGNHWLRGDGSMAIQDDGRALLPRTIAPGERFEVFLKVQAPREPGEYEIEIDLVQELVCWFAEKGSKTARIPITVSETDATTVMLRDSATPDHARAGRGNDRARSSVPWLTTCVERIRRRFRSGREVFDMNTVPRPDVEAVIQNAGGVLLRAIDDNAAGPHWCSHTYVCRAPAATPSRRLRASGASASLAVAREL